jgi:hypothetical protein
MVKTGTEKPGFRISAFSFQLSAFSFQLFFCSRGSLNRVAAPNVSPNDF